MHYVVHAEGIDPFIAIGKDGIRQAVEDLFGAERVSFCSRDDDCLYVTVVDDTSETFVLFAKAQLKIYGEAA